MFGTKVRNADLEPVEVPTFQSTIPGFKFLLSIYYPVINQNELNRRDTADASSAAATPTAGPTNYSVYYLGVRLLDHSKS